MLGAKGSAQWTMGKEKAGELLPSLPSYNNNNNNNNNNNIIIIYIIIIIIFGMPMRVSAFGLGSFIVAYEFETRESDVKEPVALI